MTKFSQLLQLLHFILHRPDRSPGDFALLKADALGAKADPKVEEQLQSVVGYHPPIDLEQLLKLPPHSFGYAYAQHMRQNHLQPLNVSSEMEEVAARNVFALRYAVTHDIFHVLLGFDTSYAGEMGVLAFAVAQNYSQSQKLGLWIAQWLYPVLSPNQLQQIRACRERGEQLGKRAGFLLGYRFEEQWERPLEDIQKELGLCNTAR